MTNKEQIQMVISHVVGTKPETKTATNGKKVVSFKVALNIGKGRKAVWCDMYSFLSNIQKDMLKLSVGQHFKAKVSWVTVAPSIGSNDTPFANLSFSIDELKIGELPKGKIIQNATNFDEEIPF